MWLKYSSACARSAGSAGLDVSLLHDRVLDRQPERWQAHLRRGRVLVLLRRTKGARDEFAKVLAAEPADADLRCLAHLFDGVTREQDGRLSDRLSPGLAPVEEVYG